MRGQSIVALGLLFLLPACSSKGGGRDGADPLEDNGPTGGPRPSVTDAAPPPASAPTDASDIDGGRGRPGNDAGVPAGPEAGDDAGVAPAECGNGVRERGEQCEPDIPVGLSCVDLGFESGELGCLDCRFVTDNCVGTERCFDARDNDGDRQVDCEDPDCEASCQASCDEFVDLADPTTEQRGDNTGHANLLQTCGNVAGGPEVVYRFQPAHTGVAEAVLQSSQNLSLSVRSSCESDATQSACTYNRRLKFSVTAASTYYIVIDGADPTEIGNFSLALESRAITCGDGHRDGSEECDDGNTTSNDGCSSVCDVEADESEPNDVGATADAVVSPFYGAIETEGDVDFVEITLPSANSSLVAGTYDFGDGACTKGELDSELALLTSVGDPIAEDDDGGERFCARLEVTGLAAGSYLLRIAASSFGATPTFPYVLRVETDVCGNGVIAAAEQCDDGNLADGDGCASDCQLE